MGIHREFLMIETDLAHQREPVGMNAGRRQAEQYITGRNRLAGDQAGFLGHADSKPGQRPTVTIRVTDPTNNNAPLAGAFSFGVLNVT